VLNLSLPLRATDLLSSPNSKPNTAVAEECLGRTAVDAKVEVQVGSVLVRSAEAVLRAERVAIRYLTDVVSRYFVGLAECHLGSIERLWDDLPGHRLVT
jgi:hypothetical protein